MAIDPPRVEGTPINLPSVQDFYPNGENPLLSLVSKFPENPNVIALKTFINLEDVEAAVGKNQQGSGGEVDGTNMAQNFKQLYQNSLDSIENVKAVQALPERTGIALQCMTESIEPSKIDLEMDPSIPKVSLELATAIIFGDLEANQHPYAPRIMKYFGNLSSMYMINAITVKLPEAHRGLEELHKKQLEMRQMFCDQGFPTKELDDQIKDIEGHLAANREIMDAAAALHMPRILDQGNEGL